jgi:hypothetical protein
MTQDFESEMKQIEQELIDLKTAAEYTSVRSANFTSGFLAEIGLYKITYTGSQDILSFVYCADSSGLWGSGNVYARTPIGNEQYVEVGYSEFVISGSTTETVPMVVISNAPIASIERIS